MLVNFVILVEKCFWRPCARNSNFMIAAEDSSGSRAIMKLSHFSLNGFVFPVLNAFLNAVWLFIPKERFLKYFPNAFLYFPFSPCMRK